MDEVIFTPEEILRITRQASQYPRYDSPNVIPWYSIQAKKPTDIVRISIKHDLILTIGTEHTGFEHINKRHGFYSAIRDWDNSLSPNPGRFSRKTIGIWDYTLIADAIYSPELKQINPLHPGKESYEGKHIDNEGAELNYRLVLYENTKVIHTLFPTEKKHNIRLPKNFTWIRGTPYTLPGIAENTIELVVPYHKNGIIEYSISIIQDPAKNTEECRIIDHDKNGLAIGYVKLGVRELAATFNDPKNWKGYKYAELMEFELEIRALDEQLNKQKK